MKTMVARYSMPDSVPDYIKGLPEGAQTDIRRSVQRDVGQDQRRGAGEHGRMGAVKNSYEKQGEEWVRKASDDQTLRWLSLVGAEQLDETNESVVQVFRTGKFKHPLYGTFVITDADLDCMEANFKASRPKAPTELVVDYEHMSAVGNQIAPAAGWVKGLIRKAGRAARQGQLDRQGRRDD